MTLKECYMKFGGDFDEVVGRLRREQLVEKLLIKFEDDKSFDLFEASMSSHDYGEALRAIHTLKGICLNLSFTSLYDSSSLITAALKENDYGRAENMLSELSDDYQKVICAIEEYKSSAEAK